MKGLPIKSALIGAGLVFASSAQACETPVSVCHRASPGALRLVEKGQPLAILADADADPAVRRVADDLATDFGRVSGTRATRSAQLGDAKTAIIIGVAGQGGMVDRLAQAGKLDLTDLTGKWEAFRQVVVDNPAPGIDRALVIAGSDRRGAVFGAYDLSEKMGVSPWHWFADVPVARRADLYLTAGNRFDAPKVRYRGFFINDEDPALKGWAVKHFGGVNADMYAHVFELGLRMKANYLWPAMWGKAFNVDDPRSMPLADEYGIVMGTSHHEPMMRAQKEWHIKGIPGAGGVWDYQKNTANLRTFWRGGIERMMSKGGGRAYDSLVTIGMRGDGDEPMAEGTATQLLETIVADQRKIIADVTGKPTERTPQVWALYKEVQDYYDHGMRVPDDVTLLFADDNWGQIRRLPAEGSAPRAGGYGIYYHFDYVGGPRSYKWINNNQIEKVWQQMDLAYRRDARQLWVVNVGDLKPMEYPLDFFLKMAWNPEAMTPAALAAYPAAWAKATFGARDAAEIGRLVTDYSKYAARRKPELIDANSFALGEGTGPALNGGEFGAIVDEWRALETRMVRMKARMRPDQQSAWFQLVEHPISAMSNLYQMYYAAAWNTRLAEANDARANGFADEVERRFKRDQELTDQYHRISGGKWDGMMNQIHMSYVSWNTPPEQKMPVVRRVDGRAAPGRFVKPTPPPAGIIAVEAPRFARAVDGKGLQWTRIADLGRTEGAVLALPQGRPATSVADNVRVEYDVTVRQAGPATLQLYFAPTLGTSNDDGLRLGVSIDDGPVRTLTILSTPTADSAKDQAQRDWVQAVIDNGQMVSVDMGQLSAGPHRVKIWRIDDNVVLQKLVLATAPVPDSYLGPAPRR